MALSEEQTWERPEQIENRLGLLVRKGQGPWYMDDGLRGEIDAEATGSMEVCPLTLRSPDARPRGQNRDFQNVEPEADANVSFHLLLLSKASATNLG